MQQTHLRNELDGEVVRQMMEAVERSYGIAQRWFELKARMLELPRLALGRPVRADWRGPGGRLCRGVRVGRRVFDGFSPDIRQIAEGFFRDRRIDAEPRAGKRGGAFCAPVAQDASPYVMMNFTDNVNDVMTLSHELGHGMHFTLAHGRQTPHSAYTGLAMAEVPSTFAEFVTFDHLLATEDDPGTRLVIAAERVEGSFATIFRQTVLARYEQRAYALRADATTLNADRLGQVWLEENRRYYGDSLDMPPGYRLGWA